MRVALVAEQLRRRVPGGIGTYARELSRALAVRSTEVELVASRASTKPDPMLNLAPLTTTLYPHLVTARLWDHDVLHLDRQVAARVDVLHATSFHYPSPPPPGDRPVLTVFVHDLAWRSNPEHFNARGIRFHEAALARSMRLARQLLVPSQRTADALVRAGFRAADVAVIPEGCDHLPAPRASAPRPDPDDPYLLTVSTLEPRKNLPALLRAFSAARERLAASGRRVRLVVVGPSGWDGQSSALPPTIPPGVELAGSVDDQQLSDLLAGALGFLYVPVLEGFGLPPLEAMRAGVPTIVSNTVPSVTERSGTPDTDAPSLLVAPADERRLAVLIERLVADGELRTEYRERGRAYAAERTWAATAAEHLACWASR